MRTCEVSNCNQECCGRPPNTCRNFMAGSCAWKSCSYRHPPKESVLMIATGQVTKVDETILLVGPEYDGVENEIIMSMQQKVR